MINRKQFAVSLVGASLIYIFLALMGDVTWPVIIAVALMYAVGFLTKDFEE